MYRRKFSNLSNAAVMLSVALLVGGCASQSQYQIQDILDARNVSDQGLELFVTGEFEKAVEAFDAVVAFGTIDDRVYTRRAAALGAMEKYDVALRDTERALALDPDNLRIHLQRAVFHQRTYKTVRLPVIRWRARGLTEPLKGRCHAASILLQEEYVNDRSIQIVAAGDRLDYYL